jgi:hypothetical protein
MFCGPHVSAEPLRQWIPNHQYAATGKIGHKYLRILKVTSDVISPGMFVLSIFAIPDGYKRTKPFIFKWQMLGLLK